ncbi:hypothetical protein DO97_03625 [Neosynechococcus sphagnicola sy1]|uniref:D-alanyl-D-alanine carboxypeptidase n=1 Tax=Neosynechococcus sphagnicola sy1 TaxID=1497020 RepID=A0A098TKM7_9CYAN|nr:D-alanyl-D-alanine carboxypeptidase/D-alanyl-D-alanine-endopeptidase [Neosynechococcus sphagnicola]KGF72836.1 hypothetical protein DO97_03625 [Neosynechococcus sphagnicola sy1]
MSLTLWQIPWINTFLLFLALSSGGGMVKAQGISPSPPPVTVAHPMDRPLCRADLARAIQGILDRPQWHRSRWGILIQTLSPPVTLFERDSYRFFIPASNVKLMTTAAALHRLGADFRMRTTVQRVNPATLTIAGLRPDATVLRLVGRGDPSFTTANLQDLAQQLRRQGILHIDLLLLDTHYFLGAAIAPSWAWEDVQLGYGAPATSLILNQNVNYLRLMPQAVGQPLQITWEDAAAMNLWPLRNVSQTVPATADEFIEVQPQGGWLQIRGQLRVGADPEFIGIPYPDPVQHFSQQLRLALAAQQITVTRTEITDTPSATAEPEVGAISSPPLAALITTANQDSNNLYAEVLLRSLGASQVATEASTATLGLELLQATLTQLGIDPGGYHLVDGSGLSRQNLVSPVALVQTLQAMAQSREASVFLASLATAGVNGTLQDRLQQTSAQGVVRGKTGTLEGVSSLSGYVLVPNAIPLVFSLMVNQSEQPTAAQRQALDEIVLLLTRLGSCP